MKIVVTGANGFVGQYLVQLLLARNYTVLGTGKGPCRLPFSSHKNFTYAELDICDTDASINVIAGNAPTCIIHAAATTQADECEEQPEKCHLINVEGTKNVVRAAQVNNSPIIYLSSDFVFDGLTGDYSEDDAPNPVSYYGQTKKEGERLVLSAGIPGMVIRTCLVYGPALSGTRNNIILWVKQNLEQLKSIQVVCDQWRSPTYVKDLAAGIVCVMENGTEGIYHVAGKERLTPFDMATKTAEFLGLDARLIEKVDASTFRQPARRPPSTGLRIGKARATGYEPMEFAASLADMFGRQ